MNQWLWQEELPHEATSHWLSTCHLLCVVLWAGQWGYESGEDQCTLGSQREWGQAGSRRAADTETDHDNILSKSVRVRLGVRPSEIKLYF